MASIKVVLKNKANPEGKYPLAIQITVDRKRSLIFLGQYVQKSDWDVKNHKVRKSHPNATRLNNLLKKKISEVNDKLIALDLEGKPISAASIKAELSANSSSKSFFAMAQVYLDNLEKSKKYNQHSADKPKIKHFKDFLKRDIEFKEITPLLLKKYQAYLKAERNVSKRTIVNHLVVIRTVFNMAINNNKSLNKHYPFGKGGIQIKFPDTKKVGLNEDELKSLEGLELPKGSSHWHTRNVWLFSFYFAGMRISDVLKLTWNDLRDGRLHYAMSKNDKVGSLKIPSKAQAILENYKTDQTQVEDFVFPELTRAKRSSERDIHNKIKMAIKKFNDDLKEIAQEADINKPLTNHIARHTFGNISGDKIPPHMLQKPYRHSSLTTTLNYQGNFIYKDADEALDAVIGN